MTREQIIQRLVYPLINEAARCLEEGIAERPEDIDLAMVFGTGFAPFRGGPLRFADAEGLSKIVATLEQLARDHGERFTPCEELRRMAEEGRSFCGELARGKSQEEQRESGVAHSRRQHPVSC